MAQRNATHSTHPAEKSLAIAASANILDPRPVAIYVNTSGTMAIENADGTTDTLTIVAGSTIPFQANKITALGGGATISGFYH